MPPSTSEDLPSGIDGLPSPARVLLGVDVAKLAHSPLVRRALGQMFLRDPGLREQVHGLLTECQLKPAEQVRSFVIALGESEDDVVLVARGQFSGLELARCVSARMQKAGGTLLTADVAGRPSYHASSGNGRPGVWFTYGSGLSPAKSSVKPTVPNPVSSIIVSASKAALTRALVSGPRAKDQPELAALLAKVDQSTGIWGVGVVDRVVGKGLVDATVGAVGAPPRAMFANLSLTDGFSANLGVEMRTEDDAKSLISFLKTQLPMLAMVAQVRSLGPLVGKVEVDAKVRTVYLRLALSAEELREFFSQIDRAPPDVEDSGANP